MSEIDLGTKLSIITDYYGVGTIWDRMDITGLTAEQITAMYNSLPGSSFTVDVTPSGYVLGRSYTNPFELPVVPGSDFDSNIPGGSYGGGNTFTGSVPGNLLLDPSTGLPVQQTAGAVTQVGGLTLATIADRISLAVAGVNIGAKLGMKIDEALYSLDPAWWDEHLPTINPETWSSLVGLNPVGDFFLRTLFGITNDNMTGYISEDVLSYYYQMLRDLGVWNSGEIDAEYDGDTSQFPNPSITSLNPTTSFTKISSTPTNTVNYTTTDGYIVGTALTTTLVQFTLYSKTRGSTIIGENAAGDAPFTQAIANSEMRTFNNTVFYISGASTIYTQTSSIGGLDYSIPSSTSTVQIGTILFDGTITQSGGIDGIAPMTGATQYPPTNITGQTPQDVKQQLQQQYPDLFEDAITETTMQEDGTTTTIVYVPIPWVTEGLNPETPVTIEGGTQEDTDIDEETGEDILPITPVDEPPQPPDTGEGETPEAPIPVGSASSLWAVYNPTQAQLNSFGAWLWSSDFVEQLKKLFADPMQAIIGVHKVFATPQTGGSQTIKCGYLDSQVSAAVVTNQYTTVDCGSASLREYFGNVFDYDPFTKISIFLPFIGIVPLNTSDVMRSTVSVKYRVDVITGACLAEVKVTRDGAGGILYTYGGSAIVTYPISSGSYVGAVQAALSTVIGIGSAIATGGASLGASAGMVLGGLSNAKTQVQHSGQFSGSSGAMGGKKPYLIISRPQTRTPSKISEYKGIPSNSIHKLSGCSGFVKVQEVHLISKTAYDNEIQEIENLLKTGVII